MSSEDENLDNPPSYDEVISEELEGAVGGETGALKNSSNTKNELSNQITVTATIFPYENFNVKEDLIKIRHAVESEDSDLMIQILCHRSTSQRKEITDLYLSTYDKPLPRDIEAHFKIVRFSTLMSGLVIPLHEYLAQAIRYPSTSFKWMCYVMFLVSNEVRQNCKLYYSKNYNTDLMDNIELRIRMYDMRPDKYIIKEIRRCATSKRDESILVDDKQVMQDFYLLKNVDIKNKDVILSEKIEDMIYTKSFNHINAVNQAYFKDTGSSIHHLIENYFATNKFILLNIINYAINPIQYYVETLKIFTTYESNYHPINIIFLTRSEHDLAIIKREFERTTGKSLREALRNATAKFYKYALYELIGETRSNKR